MSGLGGSNALFGNKLCYFPASAGVLNVIGPDRLAQSTAYLENLLSPYFSSKYVREDREYSLRKHYYSDVLSQSEFAEMISRMTSRLECSRQLRVKTTVVDVQKRNGVFTIKTADGAVIKGGNVIVGTGRSSQRWLRQTLRMLRVAYSELKPNVDSHRS